MPDGFEFQDVKYCHILSIPSLIIERGRTTTLFGPSGSGKTTILRLLSKMVSPSSGRILYNGTDLAEVKSVEHRRKVVMMSQTPVIFKGNIRDNLIAGLRFQQRQIPPDHLLVKIMEQSRLKQPLESPAGSLSGGEKQRLALGRIMLLDPEVYLLDEPSSALDDETAAHIFTVLGEKVTKENTTLIMASHSRAIARKVSDSFIHVFRGSIKYEAPR